MRFPRNYHEEPDDDVPTCDLKWSPECDNNGVYHLIPEHACPACYSLCTACQQHDWMAQIGERRLCAQCVPAAYAVSRPQGEAERHALVMAQMEARR